MSRYFILCETSRDVQDRAGNVHLGQRHQEWYEMDRNIVDPREYAKTVAAGKAGVFDKVLLVVTEEVLVPVQHTITEWNAE
jgi:hypothetical protein